MTVIVTKPTTFESASYVGRELGAADIASLQALFDANPEYSVLVSGRRPHADEAQVEFDEQPPPDMRFRSRWLTGFFDREGELVGVSNVLTDFLADGVWHIGLFLVATRLHGRGAAIELCDALEAAMAAGGARWIRLGVVIGNERADRFWARRGYREVRVRHGIDVGGRINDVRVLVKPLKGGALDDYLALVERDRSDSPKP